MMLAIPLTPSNCETSQRLTLRKLKHAKRSWTSINSLLTPRYHRLRLSHSWSFRQRSKSKKDSPSVVSIQLPRWPLRPEVPSMLRICQASWFASRRVLHLCRRRRSLQASWRPNLLQQKHQLFGLSEFKGMHLWQQGVQKRNSFRASSYSQESCR